MRIEFTKQELDARRNRPLNPFEYTDFTIMDGKQLSETCQDQGFGWATAFCQFTKKKLDIDIDVMYAQAWFSNAIEVATKFRTMLDEQSKVAAQLAKDDEE